jgi:SET domain-containing protein
MMIVQTYVGPSEIEGIGVFAGEPIKAGTVIWKFDPRFDHLFDGREIDAMEPLQKQFVRRYGYPHLASEGVTVLEFDNGRFMNHAEVPNTDFTDANFGWATRDIAEGEELTCNYGEFEPAFQIEPGRSFLGERTIERTGPLSGGDVFAANQSGTVAAHQVDDQ